MYHITTEKSECWGHSTNLSELICFHLPWSHQITDGFLMISGGVEVNWFARIRNEIWQLSYTEIMLYLISELYTAMVWVI